MWRLHLENSLSLNQNTRKVRALKLTGCQREAVTLLIKKHSHRVLLCSKSTTWKQMHVPTYYTVASVTCTCMGSHFCIYTFLIC